MLNHPEMTEKMWDLIVVGGGMAGVAAAVAAKRNGLEVLIIEKTGFLGGAPGTMLINPFMPYSTTVLRPEPRFFLGAAGAAEGDRRLRGRTRGHT